SSALLRAAETAVTSSVLETGVPQVAPVEVGEQRLLEDEFGIGRLPQQEIGGAELAGGAKEQVDIGHVRLVEEARDGVLVHPLRVDLPRGHPARDLAGGVGDLGPAAVV